MRCTFVADGYRCDFECDDLRALQKHCAKVHRRKRTCSSCGASRPTAAMLRAHSCSQPAEDRPTEKHLCPRCSESFDKAFELADHLKGVHKKRPQYRCKFCRRGKDSQRFVHWTEYKEHVRVYHEVRTRFHCEACRLPFASDAAFDKHYNKYCRKRVVPRDEA